MFLLAWKQMKLLNHHIIKQQQSQEMSHGSSTRGYSLVDELEHKAEMSYQKLGGLIGLLAFIWLLCYNAERQFPSRHILQTYTRIGQNKVSDTSYKYAKDLAVQSKGSKANEKQRADLFKKYELINDIQQNICVLLVHKQGQQNWLKSIKSIISQDYTSYRVYYFNNYQSGREIYKYIQDNALDKNKFKVIQNIPNTDYVKQFASAKNYCDKDNIVLYMTDAEKLVGNNVFLIINAFFKQNPNLKLLYSSYLVGKDEGKNSKYQIGRASNAYPQQIVKQNKYADFPYMMNGLKAFKTQLFNQVSQQKLLNSKKQPFEHVEQAALGIALLNAAKQNILYVPQLFVVKQEECDCIAIDQKVRQQRKQLTAKYAKI